MKNLIILSLFTIITSSCFSQAEKYETYSHVLPSFVNIIGRTFKEYLDFVPHKSKTYNDDINGIKLQYQSLKVSYNEARKSMIDCLHNYDSCKTISNCIQLHLKKVSMNLDSLNHIFRISINKYENEIICTHIIDTFKTYTFIYTVERSEDTIDGTVYGLSLLGSSFSSETLALDEKNRRVSFLLDPKNDLPDFNQLLKLVRQNFFKF